jgi:membrane protease YdiL (CAAX protease family)
MQNTDPFDQSESANQKYVSPPGMMEILIVIFLVIILGVAGSQVAGLIAQKSGMGLEALLNGLSENNTLENRNLVRYANLVVHFMSFTIPCIILALIMRRKKWHEYLSLNLSPGMKTAMMACLIVMVSMPFTNLVYWLNMQLPLPEWAKTLEEGATEMINALLTMDTPFEFLINLVIIALVPALGEELLFRGVFQKVLSNILKKAHLAIWITAFLFSTMHMQFEGFIPRFLLGGLLGYLFFWSKNLWVPIIAHFFFNGIQVAAKYFFGDLIEGLDEGTVVNPGWLAGIISLGLTIALALYLKRSLLEQNSEEENMV